MSTSVKKGNFFHVGHLEKWSPRPAAVHYIPLSWLKMFLASLPTRQYMICYLRLKESFFQNFTLWPIDYRP